MVCYNKFHTEFCNKFRFRNCRNSVINGYYQVSAVISYFPDGIFIHTISFASFRYVV